MYETSVTLETLKAATKETLLSLRKFDENGVPHFDEFAWPGGYTIAYDCRDGGLLCAKCASEEQVTICDDDNVAEWDIIGWHTSDWYDDSEEPWTCDNCYKVIAGKEDGE